MAYCRRYHREPPNLRSTDGFQAWSCPSGMVAATLSSMRVSGHIIGLLKEYMGDLVEQARQESQDQQAFGLSMPRYQPAIMGFSLLSCCTPWRFGFRPTLPEPIAGAYAE